MPLSAMLFWFTGRLNRARFWLASIVLILISIVLLPISLLSLVLLATSPFSLAALIAVEGRAVIPIASAGLLFLLLVYLLVFFAGLLVSCAGFAVVIKRLHDRDKSAGWLLLFILVPLILQAIAYHAGAIEDIIILGGACFFIEIWFLIELGFLRGTAGPNRYGPDPLQIGLTGSAGRGEKFATIALLTLSGVALVAELALPIVLVQHGPWSQVLSAVYPRMPAAPNEAQRQPPPAAPNEAQRQPPPAAPNAAAESGITGAWKAYDVGFAPWTLTLKADGLKLSGTVQQGAHKLERIQHDAHDAGGNLRWRDQWQ